MIHNLKLMKLVFIRKVFTGIMGLLLLGILPIVTEQIPVFSQTIVNRSLNELSQAEILQELTNADVVYLGETHDNLDEHQAQFKIIQALYQKNSNIAIALEMFQRPYQNILNQYLAREITEAELIQKSQYNQRWGYPWENYAEILRFAQQNNLPVLALNTPTEVTRKVAQEGLESLTPDEQKYIPPISEIRTEPEEYRKMLQEIYQQHHHSGKGNSAAFENFFMAQVLWDETMAETIAKFIQASSETQVIVLAGKGHIVYGYGIPSRVKRRLTNQNLVQRSVVFKSPQLEPLSTDRSIADFIWTHE